MSETLSDISLAPNSTQEVNQTAPYLIQPKTTPVLISASNNTTQGYELQVGETLIVDQDVTVYLTNKTYRTASIGILKTDSTNAPVVPAEAVYLSSVGLAIIGSTNPQVPFTTNPEASTGYIAQYSSTDSTIVQINADSTWTVLKDGSGVSIAVTLTNTDGSTVTDSSGVVTSTLSAYTDSTSTIKVGETYQLTYTISPAEVATHPELVLEFFSNDPTVATISSTGLATGVTDGDTRIGVKAKFRGAEVSDSSYFQVDPQ